MHFWNLNYYLVSILCVDIRVLQLILILLEMWDTVDQTVEINIFSLSLVSALIF